MVDSEKASESSIDAAATTTATISSATCDDLSLSLHVLDNQPIPIACITPSPKLKYKDPGDNSSDLALVKTMQLRRSPRFGSGDSSVSRKRKASVVVEMEVVREKSSRLLGNGFVMSNCNEVVDGKVLRSGKVVAVLKKCGEGIGLIEWSGKDVCGKNVLRSGKCAEKGSDLVKLPDKERRRTPVKAKLPHKEPKQTPVRANDASVSDVSSGKCLRSREIPSPVVVADHVDTNTSSPVQDHPSKDAKKFKFSCSKPRKRKVDVCFVGEPIPDVEARERWSWRYELKDQRRKGQSWILNADEEDEIILNVECHYSQAKVARCIFNIGDCAFIKGDEKEKHVGRILEFFRTTEGEDYFRVQWFYKAGDTVMKDMASFHDKKRLFYSTLMNDNLLECLISKVNVIEITRGLDFQLNSGKATDFYYDMEYCVEYSTFRNLLTDNSLLRRALSSLNYTDTFRTTASAPSLEKDLSDFRSQKADFALLDLYAGCGGMSTGLCLGAELSGVNLVTRWAVDYEKSACESLKLNHPETQVKNMPAEDFLELLKEWKQLCSLYALNGFDDSDIVESKSSTDTVEDVKMSRGEYEVSYIVDITYDTIKSGKKGLKFKVRWKGYDSDDDTWEPLEGLSNCQEHLRDFVRSGLKSRILPLPGDVDVICGGPPCQGISGYNRFRNVDAPLNDERNHQIVVFMDIVKFLKPKYVLMENVTDILRFDKGSLGRYALSRMVHMKYQARLGIMAAGCYGLPQFRLRVFLWGALPSEKLPQFPLPTHDVVVKFWPPPEFEQNTVAYNEGQPRDLEDAVVLRDAISDLPAVTSHETREEMTYEMHPETEFQKYIRSTKYEISASKDVLETESPVLYDHRPYHLNEDDYLRVCLIPRRKGANFRDLPGVTVDRDNRVCRDPTTELAKLPSGKPLVPDYVFTFEKGKSKKPFARVWWDETVGTVVTFPSCHSTAALHPEQDRVLTLREYARLQGFPDHYRFCGTMKERYCQVGNAVAVSVSRALGYALGMAFQKLGGDEPLVKLPSKFLSLVPGEAEKFASQH